MTRHLLLTFLFFAARSPGSDPSGPPSPSDNCFAVSVLPGAPGEVMLRYLHLRADCAAPDAVQVFAVRPVAADRLEAVDGGFALLPVAVDKAGDPVRFTNLTDGYYRFLTLPATGTMRPAGDNLLQLPGPYAGKYFEFPSLALGQTADSVPSAELGARDGQHLTFRVHLGGGRATAVLYQLTDSAVRIARVEIAGDADPVSMDLPDSFSSDTEVFVHLINLDTGVASDYRVYAP